ncbi:SGF29 tudor-like domain-containing protein [Pelagophyceae sp. CCMP2097]|nr:SGF29 tudor-like domain-containing protein [Pelagophyceae sp. CCMP2097]
MQGSQSVIEDLLEAITGVPNEVKRNMQLISELDEKAAILYEEIASAEAAIVQNAENALSQNGKSKPKSLAEITPTPEAFKEIAMKRRRCDALVDEKVAVARQTDEIVASHIDVMNSELASLSELLHASGEFESGAARPDEEVAIRLDEFDEDAWILARVVRFKPENACYDVADADDERKIYELPETRVVPLHDGSGRAPPSAAACSALALDGDHNRLQKGDEVFAVYPDTTSFYSAIVTIPPRRAGTGNAVCHVQFQDDADESGAIPDRPIQVKYILISSR